MTEVLVEFRVTVVVLSTAVRPEDGDTDVDRVTVPVKPFWPLTVTFAVASLPTRRFLIEVGVTVTLKVAASDTENGSQALVAAR